MHRIAISNQKGGVGKTTTAVNLASAIAARCERVLVLDLDAQANATKWLGLETRRGILDLFTEEATLASIVQETAFKGVSCVPASPGLANLERALSGEVGLETILRDALQRAPHDLWDYVIADCPPALGLVTVNALAACCNVLVPCETKTLPMQGLASLLKTIDRVRARLNPALTLLSIVPSRVVHTRLSREVIDGLRQRFGEDVSQTVIHESTRIAEAPSFAQPIDSYDPGGTGAREFDELAEEIMMKISVIGESNGAKATA